MTTKTKKKAPKRVASPPLPVNDTAALGREVGRAIETAALRAEVERLWLQVCAITNERDASREASDRLEIERDATRALAGTLAAMVRRAAREVTPRLAEGLLEDLERELRDAGVEVGRG